jgi:uncharacterized protein (DUF433 family)
MGATSFGTGSYTPTEAARLTRLPAGAIKRWLFGYSYDHHGSPTSQQPLWNPEYGVDQDEPLLGFRDLIEARMVGNLRNLGIGLPTIRTCMKTAAEIANDDHPFSSASFRTDGKRIFFERVGDKGKRDIIDLKTQQHTFARIIERSFLDLEFDNQKATRWFPLTRKKTIVVDPERSFGQPIASGSGVPTARLVQAVAAEGSAFKVAKMFEIAVGVVNDALKFEAQLKGPLTA